MVTLVKHEWHQVDSQFKLEVDEILLEEIYPDLKKKEIKALLAEIANGEFSIDQLIEDAEDNNVFFEWDRDYDDWWTERKGGFEITYEVEQSHDTDIDEDVLALEEALREADKIGLTEVLPQEWPFEDTEPETKSKKKKKK
jgi:hypothetical protein